MLLQAMVRPAVDDLLEWQECRHTIARFDTILAEMRKYGFTLVTVLLTANALVTVANPVADHIAASIVVMALLLALFLIDNYYWALLRAAVERADEIETTGKRITGLLGSVGKRAHVGGLVLAVYGLFVLIAAGIALVAALSVRTIAGCGVVVVIAAVLFDLASMGGIYLLVERAEGLPTRLQGIITRLKTDRKQ